jgi:hypothetical protein
MGKLEDAAEDYAEMYLLRGKSTKPHVRYVAFLQGAKWQRENYPRCGTCKFWIICKCTNPFRHGVEMFTGADFGCVYHEEEEK